MRYQIHFLDLLGAVVATHSDLNRAKKIAREEADSYLPWRRNVLIIDETNGVEVWSLYWDGGTRSERG